VGYDKGSGDDVMVVMGVTMMVGVGENYHQCGVNVGVIRMIRLL
jgi:hypothetical protein